MQIIEDKENIWKKLLHLKLELFSKEYKKYN